MLQARMAADILSKPTFGLPISEVRFFSCLKYSRASPLLMAAAPDAAFGSQVRNISIEPLVSFSAIALRT